MSNAPCNHCPVPGSPCILKQRGQCHHAEREAGVKAKQPGAETPYRERAIQYAARLNPFAQVDPGGRVRVAFLGVGLNSHGGTETWHATLIPRLDPKRFAVLGYGVVNPNYYDPGFARRIEASCPVPVGLESCRNLCRAADVVVVWGVTQLAPYVGLAGEAGHPITVGVSHGDGNSPWSHSVFREADTSIDHYVAVSEPARGPIPEARRADAAVIWNAVDPERLEPKRTRSEVRAECGVPDETPVVLYCGRMTEEKRAEISVKAVERLPGAVLVLAGDGYLRSDLERLAAPCADRVRFLGPREDVADLMNAADVLISPSDCEGFGLTVAEALWLGLPVVGTPVGILGERPDLARTVDRFAGVEAWVDTLRDELAHDWRQARRVERARRFARDELRPDRFAIRWADYLEGLAVSPRPVPPRPSPRQAVEAARTARSCAHRTPCGCNAVTCAIHGKVPASQCLGCPDLTPLSPRLRGTPASD
jgi:glycosyltransferase involved in cell wall biosynthesis